MLQKLLDHFTLNPKQLFLIDGLGAVVSASLLGTIGYRFADTFGMPQWVLYFLAALPCLFIVYDMICYLKVHKNWAPYIKIVVFINLFYCFLSLGFMIYFYQELTTIGLIYFSLELLVVLILVNIEWKTSKRLN